MRDELVQVAGDGADVLGNAPLVVIEDADEFFGRVRNVVKRLERNAVGQRGVAEDGDHIFIAPSLVARRGHAQRGGKAVPAWPAP